MDFDEKTSAQTEAEQREQGPDRRNSVIDRRAGLDRRQQSTDAAGYTGPGAPHGIRSPRHRP